MIDRMLLIERMLLIGRSAFSAFSLWEHDEEVLAALQSCLCHVK